ncbi:MAG TPA: beta-L-arabinofuranosidase domain-containing protein [Planctomycetota bacterium]
MRALSITLLASLACAGCSGGGSGSGGSGGGGGGTTPGALPAAKAVDFSKIVLNDTFWAPRIETNRTASLPMMYQSFVNNHNLDNFPKAAGLMAGNHDGFLWCDSDVYKTLEGMAYALKLHPDAGMEGQLEAVIANIAAAQVSSGPLAGYLNTYFQLGNAGRGSGGTTVTKQPWEDLIAMHEDYCAGHLIEAALAHHGTFGRTAFLDVARKYADHISTVFGVGRRSGVGGHQEIEIALMKLYERQAKASDLELAQWYIDERGRHSGGRQLMGEYCQDLAPLRAESEPYGHGVRGPYMWAGAVDLAAATNDAALLDACKRIWANVVERKMYVTGGTGHGMYNEGYGPDWDLSNDWAYNETCASCAMMMFSGRLANLTGDGQYMDVLERILYNGFAAGRSIDGTRLYYNNYMNRKQDKGRMGIACCASNIVRVVPSIAGYQYGAKAGDGVWTHLYMAGQATIPYGGVNVGLKQESNYPWDGDVKISVTLPAPAPFTLYLRIPGWAAGASVTLNGAPLDMAAVAKGYLPVPRTWQSGDVLRLTLPLAVRRVYSNPKVSANVGRVAVARGPIVYCLESNDNGTDVHKIVIPPSAALSAQFDGGLLGGVAKITGTGVNADNGSSTSFTMIPYGVWDNRSYDTSRMTVLVPESIGAVPVPPDRGRVGNATVSWSHKFGSDTGAACNDGLWPKGSNDQTIPRFTWWDHQGTDEWIAYEFPAPLSVWRSDIYWFADADQGGGCDFPQTFSHDYWNGSSWVPLIPLHDYEVAADLYSGGHYTIVRFPPVNTTRIRLNVKLKPGKSGGILEWRLPE